MNNSDILKICCIILFFILMTSVANARTIKTETGSSDYHESAIRRFEVVSLISLPFTAIHSYFVFRGAKMIQQREFSPDISDSDYTIIGGMAVGFAAFIGFWDWYHTRDKDTSQPKISPQKSRKKQKKRRMRQNLSFKSNLTNTIKHKLNEDVVLVQLYQIKF